MFILWAVIACSNIEREPIADLSSPKLSPPEVAEESSFKVVIDPGHGGKELGAKGYSGTVEKNIVLQLSLRVAELLAEKNINVILTRKSDETISLKNRVLIANEAEADLFLSIHANSAEAKTLTGIETFSASGTTNKPLSSIALFENLGVELDFLESDVSVNNDLLSDEWAETVHQTVVNQLRNTYDELDVSIDDNGVKQDAFYVLRKTKMPAALFECGFLSNKEEEQRLRNSFYAEEIAQALSRAVIIWKERQLK